MIKRGKKFLQGNPDTVKNHCNKLKGTFKFICYKQISSQPIYVKRKKLKGQRVLFFIGGLLKTAYVLEGDFAVVFHARGVFINKILLYPQILKCGSWLAQLLLSHSKQRKEWLNSLFIFQKRSNKNKKTKSATNTDAFFLSKLFMCIFFFPLVVSL